MNNYIYNIKDKIVDDLSKHFDNSNEKTIEFLNSIHDSNSFISGSYPLKIIMNENWKTDIDIWTYKDNDIEQMVKILMKSGFSFSQYISSFYGKNNEYSRLSTSVESIKVFTKGQLVVQIINTKVKPEEVISGFDIELCKLMFDGIELKEPEEGVIQLVVKCVNRRILKINPLVQQDMFEWFRTIKRMQKYYDRGFTNIDYESIQVSLFNSFLNTELNKKGYNYFKFFFETWNDNLYNKNNENLYNKLKLFYHTYSNSNFIINNVRRFVINEEMLIKQENKKKYETIYTLIGGSKEVLVFNISDDVERDEEYLEDSIPFFQDDHFVVGITERLLENNNIVKGIKLININDNREIIHYSQNDNDELKEMETISIVDSDDEDVDEYKHVTKRKRNINFDDEIKGVDRVLFGDDFSLDDEFSLDDDSTSLADQFKELKINKYIVLFEDISYSDNLNTYVINNFLENMFEKAELKEINEVSEQYAEKIFVKNRNSDNYYTVDNIKHFIYIWNYHVRTSLRDDKKDINFFFVNFPMSYPEKNNDENYNIALIQPTNQVKIIKTYNVLKNGNLIDIDGELPYLNSLHPFDNNNTPNKNSKLFRFLNNVLNENKDVIFIIYNEDIYRFTLSELCAFFDYYVDIWDTKNKRIPKNHRYSNFIVKCKKDYYDGYKYEPSPYEIFVEIVPEVHIRITDLRQIIFKYVTSEGNKRVYDFVYSKLILDKTSSLSHLVYKDKYISTPNSYIPIPNSKKDDYKCGEKKNNIKLYYVREVVE